MTHLPVWSRDRHAHRFGPAAQRIYLDQDLGLLSVEHDGAIGWDELQAVKDHYWGEKACAIEVYPPRERVVNNVAMRHLWRLGPDDWWPDLGLEGRAGPASTLRERYFGERIREAGR
jgi:hypothetical protein